MSEKYIALLVILAPLMFAVTAIASWFQKGLRPSAVKQLARIAVYSSLVLAAISGVFLGMYGLLQSDVLSYHGFGFGIRLDAVSVAMFSMIAILGLVIIRFSENYMDGDDRQGVFTGRLAATIASVQLLVLSGELGLLLISWILTSISLHRLLIFYPDRPGARVAARKKFIVARLGDLCLLIAAVFLVGEVGSGNLELIFQFVQSNAFNASVGIEAAALLLVVAAILKSAQFPTHGWLIEVMETPTPVSALLHAGLLNAGPFLIIRMAYVIDVSVYASPVLIIIGGFTAVFASVVFMTQTSVKTALGYSSVAHMGFSLFACGLGVFPAAMLHLVAHSFYKAHAFLSSGSVIDVIRGSKFLSPVRMGSPVRIFLGIALALSFYAVLALLWDFKFSLDMGIIAIGAVIALGMVRLYVSAMDAKGSKGLVFMVSVLATLVAAAFFILESGAHQLFASHLPEKSPAGFFTVLLTGLFLIMFAIVVGVQLVAPFMTPNSFYQSMAVHVRNGFYANALFDRLVGALYLGEKRTLVPLAKKHDAAQTKNAAGERQLKKQGEKALYV